MAYSYVQYTGNGATVAFSIPFQYITADYLEVRVDGVLTSAYTLPSAVSVQMNVAPAIGAILEIRRNTPKAARLVDFQDASILTEASLDLSADQAFHITQEAMDFAEETGAEAVTAAASAANASAVAAAASETAAALSETAAAASAVTAAAYDPALFQPVDATLTALAALDATVGLLEQTGADAFTRTSKAGIGAGKQTIWIPAGAMVPAITTGAAPGSVEIPTSLYVAKTLDFDTAADEFAQFVIRMPKSWNEGTVSAQFVWSHAATTTNFGVTFYLQAVALGNDDTMQTSWGTAQGINDAGGTTNALYHTAETPATTIAGTPAAEDFVAFRVFRDVSDAGDTMAIDARLHGVVLFYTTDANTDA